jgi:hypothetical protein
MRRWLPVIIIAALVIPSCLKKDKSNNGPKGQNHELGIGAIQPEEGLTPGGEDVLIIGFNFQQDRPVTEVLFGTTPADSFTVRSNNQIDAVTPPHARGIVDITLKNADGDEAILADGFTFHPLIRDCLTLNPTSGPDFGGTPVTITTSSFTDDFTVDPPQVYFGTTEAFSVTAVDPTTVIAVTPPASQPGSVDVTVESSDAFEICTFPLGFTYVLPGPCLTVTPDHGDLLGGYTVDIYSNGPCYWTPTSIPTFDGVPATNIIYIDPYVLQCDVPPGTRTGPVEVTVDGEDMFGQPCACIVPDAFTYDGPGACMEIIPNRGTNAGGDQVCITSLGPCNWTAGTTVTFAGVPATNIIFMSANQICCTTPAHPASGAVDVEVTGEDGLGNPCSCILPDGFTYYGGCSITSITPNNSPTNGGVAVTISGQGFDPLCNDVLFGGVYATNVVTNGSGTQITCANPPYSRGGYVDVEVITCNGGRCVIPNAFEYIAPSGSTCSITDVTPNVGPVRGGTMVTILGSGFDAETGVLFGNRQAASVVFVSSTQIYAETPLGDAPGLVDVVVAPGGSAPCVLVDGFEYQ